MIHTMFIGKDAAEASILLLSVCAFIADASMDKSTCVSQEGPVKPSLHQHTPPIHRPLKLQSFGQLFWSSLLLLFLCLFVLLTAVAMEQSEDVNPGVQKH